jgi:hypothetical protein
MFTWASGLADLFLTHYNFVYGLQDWELNPIATSVFRLYLVKIGFLLGFTWVFVRASHVIDKNKNFPIHTILTMTLFFGLVLMTGAQTYGAWTNFQTAQSFDWYRGINDGTEVFIQTPTMFEHHLASGEVRQYEKVSREKGAWMYAKIAFWLVFYPLILYWLTTWFVKKHYRMYIPVVLKERNSNVIHAADWNPNDEEKKGESAG